MGGVNKAVKSVTPSEVPAHQVRFTPERFNELVFDKGYDVWIDKALRCPCSVANAGQPLPNCDNCLGVGWFYINRVSTRIAVQGMKADVRYENWSRDTTGMAKVTSRAVDKLAFMDRIILQDVEGYYNEILRTRNELTIKVIFTIYEILEIESLYVFVGPKLPLRELFEGTDFTIDPVFKTKIKLSQAVSDSLDSESTLTVRYRHYQTYHIIDMNRDIVSVRTKGCLKPNEQLKQMPIMGYARKAHYLFDNIKYDENQRLIENSTP